MSQKILKLSELNEKSSPVKEFVQQLKKATKQKVISVVPHKIKRVSGVSAKKFDVVLDDSQKVGIVIRIVNNTADVFRVLINDKQVPQITDFDMSYMPLFIDNVNHVAKLVVAGRVAFAKKLAAVKVKLPHDKRTNNKTKYEHLLLQLAELDSNIRAKEDELAQINNAIALSA